MNTYEAARELYLKAVALEGGTVARGDLKLPLTGYYIGGEGAPLVYDSVTDVDRGEIGWWLGHSPADYVGVWVDTDDGKVYFDGVTHMYNLGPAMDLGAIRGEKAIWEIHNNKEVRLP